jgi:hypothetical protein
MHIPNNDEGPILAFFLYKNTDLIVRGVLSNRRNIQDLELLAHPGSLCLAPFVPDESASDLSFEFYFDTKALVINHEETFAGEHAEGCHILAALWKF